IAWATASCMNATEEITSTSAAMSCALQGCGANAATVGDGIFFDWLDASGAQPNSGGVRLSQAWAADGTPLTIHVVGDRLIGAAIANPAVTYTGTAAAGIVLVFTHDNGAEYQVRIADMAYTSFWTAIAPSEFPVYQLLVRKTRMSNPGLYQGP